MNFYNYLKNKVLLFENTTNPDYYYDGKKFYPIVSENKFYYGINKYKEIDTKSTNHKIKNGNIFIIKSGNPVNISVLEKSQSKNNNQKQADYIEIDNVFYPIFKNNDKQKGYVNNLGEFILINLNDYEVKKQSISDYYIKLGSSPGGSSGGNELPSDNEEPIADNEEPIAEETPSETPEEVK